eukprot:s786_g5.t1
MQFGKELEKIDIPKYRGNYIQYNELKKAIKVFTGQDKDNASVKEVTHWTSSFLRLGPNPDRPPEARLNEILTGELNRVSKFVLLEEAATKQQLEALLKDAQSSNQAEDLCRRYEELGTDICNLKSFSQVNFSGFRKALKKYDKWSQKSTMQWFMSQVVKAPLMCIDFEGMLELMTDIGTLLRQKGMKPGQDVKSSSHQEEYKKSLERGSRERTFLLEAKAAINLRVKLAAFMAEKFPEERAAMTSSVKRPNKMTSIFLDTREFKVYKEVLNYNSSHAKPLPCPASLHLRYSERSQVVSVAFQAGEKGRKEILLRSEDVPKLLQGQVPPSTLTSTTAGARSVMGSEPPTEQAALTLQEVIKVFGNSLRPQAQATYSRSFLQDDSGVMVILDEDIRIGKIEDLNGAVSSMDFFDYMVVTIVFPSTKNFTLPRWLGLLEDCAVLQANGFSKGAQAIARFHALGQSLPMPHWYTNVYSEAKGGEQPHMSAEHSEGSFKGKDADIHEEELPVSPRWTTYSERLLHEFGTTPEQEMQMTASRRALARGSQGSVPAGTVPVDREEAPLPLEKEASEDKGNLSEPLLSRQQDPPVPAPGIFQRLWGTETVLDKDKPVRRAIVAVQPKTLYSNERTFLEWIHFATILAAAGILMLHTTQEAGHVIIGRLMVLAAIFLVVWSMHVFNWRADGLDLKVDMSYEDHVGPVALVGSILTALILSSIHAACSSVQ